MARRTSYASSATPTLSLSLHTIQNLYSSKAVFFSFSFDKGLNSHSLMLYCKSVQQAPLYKLMTVPAHGHLSARLIQTSISKSMLFFRISSLTFPFCTQEPLSVDGMKVFAYPSAKQPFWSSTLFLKLLPLFLVNTNVAKLFVSRCPPVLHFFVHRAFICTAVNSDAFYIFVITCGTGAGLNTASSFSIIAKSTKCWAGFFGKKHSPFFQKILLRSNNLPIQQISMTKQWKDTHLILWHVLQNKFGLSRLLCTFKSPDHGDELSSQIPHSREDKF